MPISSPYASGIKTVGGVPVDCLGAPPLPGYVLQASATAKAAFMPTGIVTPNLTAALSLGGVTTESAAVPSASILVPANMMTGAFAALWRMVLLQTLHTTAGTCTIKIHYGPLGTNADPLLATLAYGTSTSIATPQILDLMLNFRSLGAPSSCYATGYRNGGSAAGIGGAIATATLTLPATQLTTNVTIANYFTITFTFSSTTTTYSLVQSYGQILEL